MENNVNTRVHKAEVEQVAEVQGKLTDPKKWILYGFALALKAENFFDGNPIPPQLETKSAV